MIPGNIVFLLRVVLYAHSLIAQDGCWWGEVGRERKVTKTMYTYVSKCKNNKINFFKKIEAEAPVQLTSCLLPHQGYSIYWKKKMAAPVQAIMSTFQPAERSKRRGLPLSTLL
jgi:hypothetical protein